MGTATHDTIISALDAVNPSPFHRRILLSKMTNAHVSNFNQKQLIESFKYGNGCLLLQDKESKLPNRIKTDDVIFTIPVCPKCKKSKENEITFWALYEMGVPVCTECDEDIWVNDIVTIRKGA